LIVSHAKADQFGRQIHAVMQGGIKQAVRISVPWLIINIVIAVLGNAVMASVFGMQLAWAAHIGGVVGGIVLFPLLLALFNVRLWRLVKRIS